jgi:hypothetical protein
VTAELVVDRADLAGDEEATATFSADRSYRYALTRRWSDNPATTVFIMTNPSTADAFKQDPTVRRCVRFAQRWGAGGLLVVNAFGLRSPNPRVLYQHPDPVGPDNDAVIAELLPEVPADSLIVAAWGTHGRLRGRGKQVTELVNSLGWPLRCLGRTNSGQPRHPLYVSGLTAPRPMPVPIVEPVTRRLEFRALGEITVTKKVFDNMATARQSGRQDVCMVGTVRVDIFGADGALLSTCTRTAGNRWRDLCRGTATVTADEQSCSCGGVPTVAVGKTHQYDRHLGWFWSCDRCGSCVWSHIEPT